MWELPDDGGAAVADLECGVLDAGGVVLRYGRLYGPGTYYPGELPSDTHVCRSRQPSDARWPRCLPRAAASP